MDVSKLTNLSNDDLAALADGVQAEVRARQPKYTLDDIKPGMSNETKAGIRAELERAIKELTGGR